MKRPDGVFCMRQDQIIEGVLQNKVIAIVRGANQDNIVHIAEALYAGGIRFLEVTFPYKKPEKYGETTEMIRMLVSHFEQKLHVGAGTVMTPECTELAANAGASYIISPNTDARVIRKTKELGLVSIPGAYTPTEIAEAIAQGADFVKLFPAAAAGSAYIKAVLAPLRGVKLIATGGISLDNCAEFLQCGCVGLGVGGKLADLNMIAQKRYEELTKAAELMLKKLKEAG